MKDMVFAANVILDKILDSGTDVSPHFDAYKDVIRMFAEGDAYESARLHHIIYSHLPRILDDHTNIGILYYFSWAVGSMVGGYESRQYRITYLAACANFLERLPKDAPQGFAIVNNILNSAPK